MVNKLIDSISETLSKEFENKCRIYDEAVEQSLKTPCFFINVGNLEEEQKLGNRYLLTNPIIIQYLSNSREKKRDCNNVRERLAACLEYITIDNMLIRGTKMNSDYSDGILTFEVNYDFFVIKKQEQKEKINDYNLNNKVKGDKNGKK